MIVGILYSGEVERITIWVSYAQDSWLDSSHRNQILGSYTVGVAGQTVKNCSFMK